MESDLDEELLGIAEGKPRRASSNKKRGASPSDGNGASKRRRGGSSIDPDETESERGVGDDDEEEEDEDEDGEGEMDLDVESEDGYDPSTRPAAARSGDTSAAKADSPPARPAAVKRSSSSKTKKARAPAAKKAPAPKAASKAKPAKKGQAVKRTGGRASGKATTEKKDASALLYPLEGKYQDEDDRDYLDRLPEIEREQILATRLEEQQREIDRQALGDLYKQTVGKLNDVAEEEPAVEDDDEEEDMDMDIDEDEDEVKTPAVELDLDLPRKPGKKDITSNAINALKERREARSNRADNKSDRPAGRRLGDADYESDSPSSEEGSIGEDRHGRRRGGSESDDAYMGDGGTRRRRGRHQENSPKRPELPVTPEDLNGVRLSRWELVDIKHRDFFKEMAVGAFVKCSSGVDANQRLKYRVFEIVDVEPQGATYRIEYKGKEVPEDRKLLLRYGNVNKAYKMSDVSNQPFDNHEFVRWKATTEADKQPVPSKSKLRAKHNQMKEFRDRPWTEAEIHTKLASYQALGQMSSTKAALKRSRLISEVELAKRSDDTEWLLRAQEELDAFEASMGGSGRGNEPEEGVNQLLAKVNEKNKRDAAETARRAHKADQIRRKLTDEMGMLDPSARVKMKMYKHDAGVPEALAKSIKELEQKKLGEGSAAQSDIAEIQAIEGKSLTPFRRLDAVVASSVDLDLGDF